jgi:hypothetical protein
MTVGYDARFAGGDYGVWVACPPDKYAEAKNLLNQAGAVEVRDER